MNTQQDFMEAYTAQLRARLEGKVRAQEKVSPVEVYQAELAEQVIANNKVKEAERLADLTPKPKLAHKRMDAMPIKRKFALWLTHSTEESRNRRWSWEELAELLDHPHNMALAGVLRSYGWYKVEHRTWVAGLRVQQIWWCPPTLPREPSITLEYIAGVLATLPKVPHKFFDIHALLKRKPGGTGIGKQELSQVLWELGWVHWVDWRSKNWWLGPDTPVPIRPNPRGPVQKLEKPKRPRGRPRKQPFPISEQSS